MVESLAYGTGYDRVRIGVDRVTGEIVRKSAQLPATTHAGVAPDPSWRSSWPATPSASLRSATAWCGFLERDLDSDELTRLAADAQRSFAEADVAFVNPGNTRRPGMDAGEVTYAEAFLVHAYEHPIAADEDARQRRPRGLAPARLARALRERPRERPPGAAPTASRSTRCWRPRRASTVRSRHERRADRHRLGGAGGLAGPGSSRAGPLGRRLVARQERRIGHREHPGHDRGEQQQHARA